VERRLKEDNFCPITSSRIHQQAGVYPFKGAQLPQDLRPGLEIYLAEFLCTDMKVVLVPSPTASTQGSPADSSGPRDCETTFWKCEFFTLKTSMDWPQHTDDTDTKLCENIRIFIKNYKSTNPGAKKVVYGPCEQESEEKNAKF